MQLDRIFIDALTTEWL